MNNIKILLIQCKFQSKCWASFNSGFLHRSSVLADRNALLNPLCNMHQPSDCATIWFIKNMNIDNQILTIEEIPKSVVNAQIPVSEHCVNDHTNLWGIQDYEIDIFWFFGQNNMKRKDRLEFQQLIQLLILLY